MNVASMPRNPQRRAPLRAARATTRARGGFSLVELMGVCFVLALIASVAYVSYQSMLPQAQLHKAVRELAATIQGARSDAIARSARFDVLYDFDGDLDHGPGYAVVSSFKHGGGMVQYSGDPEDEGQLDEQRVRFEWQELPEWVRLKAIVVDGIAYNEGLLPVRFDPLGASAAHTIVLEQPEWGHAFTIEVIGLTGLIRFHEGEFLREPPDEGEFR